MSVVISTLPSKQRHYTGIGNRIYVAKSQHPLKNTYFRNIEINKILKVMFI
jgi:hypothetical protein